MSLITVSKIQKETSSTNIDVPSTGQFIDLASAAQGDVLYYNGTSYVRLAPGTSGHVLTSGGAGANPSWAAAGITNASSWGQTATQTGSKNPITADLALRTTAGQGNLGDAMTVDTGVFTFPSTGFWQVLCMWTFQRAAGDSQAGGFIKSTTDNGTTWTIVAAGYKSLDSIATYGSTSCSTILDITDTSNNKVSFQTSHDNAGNNTTGNANGSQTSFTFIRLADT